MQALRRRSSALVWLNPLLDTPGYEPTALGMTVAKPFITTFTSVNDWPASFDCHARCASVVDGLLPAYLTW